MCPPELAPTAPSPLPGLCGPLEDTALTDGSQAGVVDGAWTGGWGIHVYESEQPSGGWNHGWEEKRAGQGAAGVLLLAPSRGMDL